MKIKYKHAFSAIVALRFFYYLAVGFYFFPNILPLFFSLLISLILLCSLIYIYKNANYSSYLYVVVSLINILSNVKINITLNALVSIIFWDVLGVYVSYRSYQELGNI